MPCDQGRYRDANGAAGFTTTVTGTSCSTPSTVTITEIVIRPEHPGFGVIWTVPPCTSIEPTPATDSAPGAGRTVAPSGSPATVTVPGAVAVVVVAGGALSV